MKRLTFHDMNKEDCLQLSFDGAFDHRSTFTPPLLNVALSFMVH